MEVLLPQSEGVGTISFRVNKNTRLSNHLFPRIDHNWVDHNFVIGTEVKLSTVDQVRPNLKYLVLEVEGVRWLHIVELHTNEAEVPVREELLLNKTHTVCREDFRLPESLRTKLIVVRGEMDRIFGSIEPFLLLDVSKVLGLSKEELFFLALAHRGEMTENIDINRNLLLRGVLRVIPGVILRGVLRGTAASHLSPSNTFTKSKVYDV
jgi:hypothetical protein